MNTTLSRRNWIKSGLITAGGMALSNGMTFANGVNKNSPKLLDINNQNPFFNEYTFNSAFMELELKAKLNANENPYGPANSAMDALKDAVKYGNRYGWKALIELVQKISALENVSPKNIIMGPGSSDLLEKTAMVFFQQGGNIVSADPSYMSLVKVAQASGASWKGIPLKEDWSHDLDAMEKAIDKDTKLVYICNPNNPTGTITDSIELLDFCRRVSEKVTVFIDEAYMDFLEDAVKNSMVSLINEGKDVIIARTFSKIYGMAGLRVGYIVAQPETLDKIQKITRAGMGISYPSIFAAKASLDDVEFQKKSRKLNAEAREFVYASLSKMGFNYVPSFTSFIIFPIALNGKLFLKKMYSHQVAVRSFDIKGKDWCRVSMGTMDEMKIFVQTLNKVLS